MQIHQSGSGPTVGLSTDSANASSTAPVPVVPSAANQLVGGVRIVGSQAADQLASLGAQLKDAPDTREDVVSQVRERIELGYYLTRDAAERTAARLQGT